MSTTETMTIHKALCELKVLGDRICSSMNSSHFVIAIEHATTKISGVDKNACAEHVRSVYQQTTDLMRRREAIKRAVVLSNATTKVVIAGVEYTVAEAIDMKNNGLIFKKELVAKMTRELHSAKTMAERANGRDLESRADGYLRNMYGATDMKNLTAEATNEREKFIEQHTTELFDPIKVADKIAELEKEIHEFAVEVDAALSTSNAITEIEISY